MAPAMAGGYGALEILSASGLSLIVVELDRPSFSEADGVLSLAGAPLSALAIGTGMAAQARFIDSDGDAVISGLTVGVDSGHIQLNSVDIVEGLTVTITSGRIRHSNLTWSASGRLEDFFSSALVTHQHWWSASGASVG